MTGTFSFAHFTLKSASFKAFVTELYSLFFVTNSLNVFNFSLFAKRLAIVPSTEATSDAPPIL